MEGSALPSHRDKSGRTDAWIHEQIGDLTEQELLLVHVVLEEIRERRADGTAAEMIEHFPRGTVVHVAHWADAEFIVQGTALQRDERQTWRRLIEVRSPDGSFSGAVSPAELTRAEQQRPERK